MRFPLWLLSRRLLIAAGLLWLAGCATAPPLTTQGAASPGSAPSAAGPQGSTTNGTSSSNGNASSGGQGGGQGQAASSSSGPPLHVRADKPRYSLTGALTTEYLYNEQLSPSPSEATENRLSEYLNFRWKNNMGPDIRIYFYGMYSHEFLTQGDDQYKIYKFFAEWNNMGSVLNLRVGRQPASGNTLFSRFDGVTIGYKLSPLVTFNIAGGLPVNTFTSNRLGIQTDERFYEAYLSVYDWYHFGGKLFFTQQFYQSFLTRSAAGLNGYWMKDNLNLSSIVDYDLNFMRLNDALLSADYAWGPVRYSAAAEYRKNPFLDYETALQDPNFCGLSAAPASFADLTRQLSRSEIETCALKNTFHTVDLRGGVSIDFSKVWHAELRYAHTTGTGGQLTTVGGTTTMSSTDQRSDRVSLFVSERNGLQASEVWTLLLMYEPWTDYETMSVFSTLSKYWWGNSLQAGLRFRGDQTTYHATGNRTTQFVPGFILSYSLPSGINASLEGDYDILKSNGGVTTNTIETRTTITIPF